METNFWKNYKNQLITLVCFLSVGCLVALAFFRTELFIKTAKNLVSILTPFVYGFAIAYLLHPLARLLETWFLRFLGKDSPKLRSRIRLLSVLLSLALLFFALIALLLLMLPQIIASLNSIASRLPRVIDEYQAWLSGFVSDDTSEEVVGYANQVLDTVSRKLLEYLQTSLLPSLQTTVNRVTSSFMGILDVVKNFGLGCIISVYFLGSWEKFGMQAKLLVYSLFPRRAADWIRSEAHFTDRMFSGFIIGKIVDSLIVGVICFIGCNLFRFPYSMLVSVIVGVTNVIPFFGPYLGAIPSTLLILTESPLKATAFFAFVMVLQQVDGNVIGPRILGDRLGISSFWILFSILFFGAVWGLPGMLVGAPVFAVLYDIARKLIHLGLKERGCEDLAEEYRQKYGD